MKLLLKSFQETAVEELYQRALRQSRNISEGDDPQALVLASPTGSGKTVIATALMETIVEGDETHAPDEHATFLWLTDAPDLNEQSRRKIMDVSTVFGFDDLVTVDSDFDQRVFEPGKVYFLNTQKLGKEKNLVSHGDDRTHTLWETVNNTIQEAPGSFWLVLDEAHKGMLQARDEKLAATIVQKFVKGSSEVNAVPLVLGISATPDRFNDVLEGKGTTRVKREYVILPDDVRGSGLLKDTIRLIHPSESQPSDWSLLRAAAERLKRYRDEWQDYCTKQGELQFEPVLVVQVEDTDKKNPTKTDLLEALTILEDVLGPLEDYEIAQCFQEGTNIAVGERVIRHISPADIQDDEELRVVFFKLSLNTGWDCPRAEVIMSFRTALDHTGIAQLVGRLVRTPLARSIKGDDFLNSVSLFLPHYDKTALKKVVAYLSQPETGLAAPPEIVDEEDLVELPRVPEMAELFELVTGLPTYTVEKISKATNVRRLIRLGRALAYDKLDPKALDQARKLVLTTIEAERAKSANTTAFKNAIKAHAKIDLRSIAVAYGSSTSGDSEDDEGQEKLNESFESVAAVTQNIEDLYDAVGRKLGEGLHAHWVKARVAAGERPTVAKLELHELLSDQALITKLEEVAGKQFQTWAEQHKAAIADLLDGRKETYRKLRRQAAKPEAEELELPQTFPEQRGPEQYEGHIYADKTGEFASKLTTWEQATIEAELSRKDVMGWFRNLPRKSWALTVPYRYDGEDTAMYPDFLFFRKQGDGIVVDILEPHSTSQDDAWAKAVGLAEYARAHGERFGRIEMIIKEKGSLIRLDVNNEKVRDKVLKVSDNMRLRELFASEGVSRNTGLERA
jgi:type III restriction enzyme